METMTVSGFRKNMAAAFNKAASGEHVMVRRGSQIFAIVPVDDKELTITPELQTKLDVARGEIEAGGYTTLRSYADIDKYFDNL